MLVYNKRGDTLATCAAARRLILFNISHKATMRSLVLGAHRAFRHRSHAGHGALTVCCMQPCITSAFGAISRDNEQRCDSTNASTARVTRRSFAVEIRSPPISNTDVMERPETILLLEDEHCLQRHGYIRTLKLLCCEDHCQHDTLLENGYSYGRIELRSDVDNGTHPMSVEDCVNVLKNDLMAIPHSILVTRGPMSSWYAQLYLESGPLHGLIMIDPIDFSDMMLDNDTGDNTRLAMKTLLGKMEEGTSQYHQLNSMMQSIKPSNEDTQQQEEGQQSQSAAMAATAQGTERVLKLEPGSVPMMIFSAEYGETFEKTSRQVADRHRSPDGMDQVRLYYMEDGFNALTMVSLMMRWLDDEL